MGHSLLPGVRAVAIVLLIQAAHALTATVALAADPDALWKIVHDRCEPAQLRGAAPDPCQWLDPDQHYAILKDRDGALQYLLIPTDRVTGIEDPQILSPGATNYWERAWEARRFLEDRAGRPIARDNLTLAINSVSGRSQNQLHIHIDCIRSELKQELRDNESRFTANWTPLNPPFHGHPYLVRRITADELAQTNPFTMLANTIPGARADMGHQTLVIAGTTFSSAPDGIYDGFYLLTDHADPGRGDRASGEELQDHACAVLNDRP
ncbi:MAG: CDP-diacylglycerol diphosphatase [Azospirillaceae bacterium]|nr:CDP-diacylglycerol diphosphatase [Azospirillaceae bacterium]